MIPTNKLRFVKRKVYVNRPALNAAHGQYGTIPELGEKTILQQWWEVKMFDVTDSKPIGEWRDVPVEEE